MSVGLIIDEGFQLERDAVVAGTAPAPRRAASAVEAPPGTVPRFSSSVRVLDRVHGCAWSIEPVVVDAAAATAAAIAMGVAPALALLVGVVVVAAFSISSLYGQRTTLETQGVFWYVSKAAGPFAGVVLLAVVSVGTVGTGGPDVLAVAGAVAVALFTVRLAIWCVVSASRTQGLGLRRTIVVGRGQGARTVVAKLREYPEAGLLPVGIVSPDGSSERGEGVGTGALPTDLPAIVRHRGITHVVLAPTGNDDGGVAESIALCDGLDVGFSMLPPLSDLFLHPGLLTQVGGLPLLVISKVGRNRPTLPVKRAFDLLAGGLLLLLCLPLVLVAAAAVKACDGGPAVYRQRRVGLDGRVFTMLKLRSMVPDADRMVIDLTDRNCTDGLLFKVADDPRVTTVGRWIRKLSIDELPQLWNVVRGDMSLVGPRPLPVDPDDFGALDGKRHAVRPGITGYWQIAGGTGLTYEEMVKLDLSYIQNWSLWLDLRLLFRTVPAIVGRHRHGAV